MHSIHSHKVRIQLIQLLNKVSSQGEGTRGMSSEPDFSAQDASGSEVPGSLTGN